MQRSSRRYWHRVSPWFIADVLITTVTDQTRDTPGHMFKLLLSSALLGVWQLRRVVTSFMLANLGLAA